MPKNGKRNDYGWPKALNQKKNIKRTINGGADFSCHEDVFLFIYFVSYCDEPIKINIAS